MGFRSLPRLARCQGFDGVNGVRQGKYFEIELAETDKAEAQVKAMCEKLIANTVIKNYAIELE
jgi:phosphoribosylformylglycinamidine synthase subunit PurS